MPGDKKRIKHGGSPLRLRRQDVADAAKSIPEEGAKEERWGRASRAGAGGKRVGNDKKDKHDWANASMSFLEGYLS